MSFFVILILIVALWWLLRPLIHQWMMRQAQKRMENFFRAATGQSASYDNTRRRRNDSQTGFGFWPFGEPAQTRRRRRHKKIDPDVGEYVEFEEIKNSPSDKQNTQQEVKFEPEQQIEDAEWEDIK